MSASGQSCTNFASPMCLGLGVLDGDEPATTRMTTAMSFDAFAAGAVASFAG